MMALLKEINHSLYHLRRFVTDPASTKVRNMNRQHKIDVPRFQLLFPLVLLKMHSCANILKTYYSAMTEMSPSFNYLTAVFPSFYS